MMHTQALHLLAFAFLDRRVVSNQVACHDGQLGTTSTFRLLLALSLQVCGYLRLHLLPKVLQPPFDHGSRFPGRLREKAT
jgi:hypothetical protein